ncbi:hypothetical protein SAMN05216297_104198 [Flavobacterium phragmitis]|uniref:Uncharacterized protein n=1 Tax=Flavobacterium phragmitis TaxID=739143 RepID=A0A1I1PJB7_9FLAO|nr:hypothetical protein SAMN05216297_104198 [Flavobacterium phragmitis]
MKLNKKGDKKYVKFSMAFSNVPIHSKIFTEQQFLSEELTLKELINECPLSPDRVDLQSVLATIRHKVKKL